MGWTVETLNKAVDNEIGSLPGKLRGRFVRLMEMIEKVGLHEVHHPHVKHVEGKLWELRAKGEEGIARGIYVAMNGKRVIVLHVFMKKSQKTPTKALDVARSRAKMVM